MKDETIAGFFMGEGCVSISVTAHGVPRVRVSIGQRDREILDAISAAMGVGHVSFQERNGRPIFLYRTTSKKDSLLFYSRIPPFVIGPKKEQIEAALEILSFGDNRILSEQQRERRLELVRVIQGKKASPGRPTHVSRLIA